MRSVKEEDIQPCMHFLYYFILCLWLQMFIIVKPVKNGKTVICLNSLGGKTRIFLVLG